MVDVENYQNHLNDRYLSLATGSEGNFKFKVRNSYEEVIYKTEDKMYELDAQIDNIQRCSAIVDEQFNHFEALDEADQLKYKFPIERLTPLRFYWN